MDGEDFVLGLAFFMQGHEVGPFLGRFACGNDGFVVAVDDEVFLEVVGDVIPDLRIREVDVECLGSRVDGEVPGDHPPSRPECLMEFFGIDEPVYCVVHPSCRFTPEECSALDALSPEFHLFPAASSKDRMEVVV